MVSRTKEVILQNHQQNHQLHTPVPSPMPRNSQDVAADEMMNPLDEQIIASTLEALESGQTHYVDVPGIAPLREAVAEHLNDTLGTQYKKANILITAGMQETRFLTIQKISELYDSITIPDVVHPGVLKALGVRTRNIVSIPVDFDRRLLSTIDSIQQAIASGSRLLYLESPSRLTGATYTQDEVNTISKMAQDNNIAIIWDQGLAPWVVDNYATVATLDTDTTQTATIGEIVPGMGLASWFIGYIAAPEDWIVPMQSQKQIMAICTSTPAQYAALSASELYGDAHANQLQQLSQTKATLISLAKQANLDVIAGHATNIIALRVSEQDKDGIVAKWQEAGYTVADGQQFGAPNVLRLNVGGAAEQALKQLN